MSGTINFPQVGPIGSFYIGGRFHGDWQEPSYLGNMFFATTATAGTVVPIQASNLAATFVLANPAGNTKNVELVFYVLGLLNATTVVSDVSLYYQTSYTALTSTTAITAHSTYLGGSATPTALTYSAATFTGALTKGPTLVSFGATTDASPPILEVPLSGRIVIAPGTAVALAGNAAQTQAMQHTFYWIEF